MVIGLKFSSQARFRNTRLLGPLGTGLNKYYNISNILIVRPDASFSGAGLAGTFKLRGTIINGTIGVGHDHSNAGSYSISLNDKLIAGDVGRGNYDSFTFSSKRFDNIIYNSFGHPVPVLNNNVLQMQS